VALLAAVDTACGGEASAVEVKIGRAQKGQNTPKWPERSAGNSRPHDEHWVVGMAIPAAERRLMIQSIIGG
jgi:hypothetical protein